MTDQYKTNKIYQGDLTYTFNKKHIQFKSGSSESKTEWILLHSIVETKKYVYLLFSKKLVISLPRRAFKDQKDYIQLRKLLSTVSKRDKIPFKKLD